MRSGSLVACLAASAIVLGGCGRSSPASSPTTRTTTPTFNKDIAPIVFANCAPCHRPGEVAPFPLLWYADALKHADKMAEVTLAHEMPPWLPDPGEFPIIGERRLRADQIDTIQRWVKGGKVEGNASDLPQAPTFPDGWRLGKPDVIVTPARPYRMGPAKDDVYRNLVIHTPLKSNAFVRAVEFKTGGAPIHHAVIRVDRTSHSSRRDGEDGQPGFSGMAWGTVQDPEGQFVGWAPGRGPIVSPDGMPWPLERGADLVVELHVIATDKPLTIQPTIGLFLSATPPVQTPLTVRMGSKLIDIPAGKRDHVITDTYDLPVPVDLLSVYPHAHYLGKDMLVTAALPDGIVKTLIHIKQWSLHWQQDYRFVTPIPLPQGTRLTMRYTYDNSDDNEENPNYPAKRVRLGPRSVDEMAELGLLLLPKSPADAAQLANSFGERASLKDVEYGEMRVNDAPNVADNQSFLGSALLEAGRFADAIPHLEAAIRIDGRSASAHGDLGTALMQQGRLNDALVHLARAAALSPRDETMQSNFGNALAQARRIAEAGAAYERALALNPDFLDAHVNLGALLMSIGKVPEALKHFERAVDLKPDSAVLHSNLSSALAAAGRFPEAMTHVRRALEINPGYAPAQENLRRFQQMGIK